MIKKWGIHMLGLKYILNIENMTQKELANKIGITNEMVNHWVQKRRPISPKRIMQIHTEIFPIYPIEYYTKEISEGEMAILQNIKQAYRHRSSSILYPLTISALLDELGGGKYFNSFVNNKLNTFDIEIYDQLREIFRGIILRYEKRHKIHKALVARLETKKAHTI